MVPETDPYKNDAAPEASEKAGKQWGLSALILAGVFLLGIFLPPEYKGFAPILFLVPVILSIVNKLRQASEKSGDPSRDRTYPPPMPPRMPSPEPYSYKPKDPRDPRKYKPIG